MKYCFIADVHSNLPALEEIISASRKFLIDKYICLGDMVGYGPYPNETVDLIKTLVFTSCGGNHDFAAIGRLEKDDFNKLARQAIEWTESVLTDTSIKYLNTLEPSKKIEDKFEIVHGALTNPLTDYIINKWIAVSNFKLMTTRICFFGHTHIPRIFALNEHNNSPEIIDIKINEKIKLNIDNFRYLINPGSAGQPRDGNPDAAYCVFDTDDCSIIFLRAEYSVHQIQQEMQRLKFPEYLTTRLSLGV